jgi:tetratricopeptide (TPR) repeat protein
MADLGRARSTERSNSANDRVGVRDIDERTREGDGGPARQLDETDRLQARRGSILAAAVALGAVAASVYTIAPGLDEPDGPARRAAIEDRFFRPDGRIAEVRSRTTDPNQLRYLDTMDWQVAEVAASAPDGWPYSRQPLAKARPGDAQKRATALVQEKKLDEARTELLAARETFPFARCDFTDDLSVVLYLSGRKDEAIAELESVRPLTRTRTSPGCRKSLFHLGSLYLERGRSEDAAAALREYLALTEGYQDADTVKNRQAASSIVRSPAIPPPHP